MTLQQLINYYANLLILQYIGKQNAYALMQAVISQVIVGQYQYTVQTISFSPTPKSGAMTLGYGPCTSSSITVFSTAAQIQTILAEIIPQWNATTTYAAGAFVQYQTAYVYQSLVSGNIGNPVSNPEFWEIQGSYAVFSVTGTISNGPIVVVLVNIGPALLYTLQSNSLDTAAYIETEVSGDIFETEGGSPIVTEM